MCIRDRSRAAEAAGEHPAAEPARAVELFRVPAVSRRLLVPLRGGASEKEDHGIGMGSALPGLRAQGSGIGVRAGEVMMKLHTGLHPRNWHWGAWVVLIVLAVLVLVLTHRPTVGYAMQQDPSTTTPDVTTPAPDATTTDPSALPDVSATPPPAATGAAGNGYVAEIVDSSYFVGPAEFFALDLPTQASGARATHLFGTVTTQGKKDIMVRLFKATDYDRWLKQ